MPFRVGFKEGREGREEKRWKGLTLAFSLPDKTSNYGSLLKPCSRTSKQSLLLDKLNLVLLLYSSIKSTTYTCRYINTPIWITHWDVH